MLILPGLVPLVRGQFFDSPDAVLHAYRLVALDTAVRSGVLYPRWFPEFTFGYGFPLFNFFGPASYYWGLPFTLLGANAALALKLALATGQLASALGMYRFARQHLRKSASILAAVAYAYLPYHLVDLYVRGAVGEAMAFVWLPWILWAVRRASLEPGTRGAVKAGLAGLLLAALVWTHNLTALAFAPVLAGYLLLLWLERRERRIVGRAFLSLGSALAFGAFYWLPMLAESRNVGLTLMRSQGYQAHMLPLGRLFALDLAYRYTGLPGEASVYPIGLLQAAILIASLIALLYAWRRRSRAEMGSSRLAPTLALFLIAALVSIFFLTTASLPVWRGLELVMAYFQFPWRLQVITVLATAFLAGAVWHILPVDGGRGPARAGAILAAACLCLMAWSLWRLPITPISPGLAVEDMWSWERRVGQVGTTWDAEFLPVWVTEQRWAISQPVAGAQPASPAAAFPDALPRLTMTGAGYAEYQFTLDAPAGAHLVLHQFHFPGWQARWQGTVAAGRPEGALGLAAFDLAPGSGDLILRLGLTPAQVWGTWLSVLALLAGGVGLVAYAQLAGRRSPARTLLLAAACLVPAAALLAHLALPNGYVRPVTAVNANLDDQAELLAYTGDRAAYHPGDTVQVTLYWLALRDIGRDLKSFVHLTDAALTRQPAQHDGDPGSGYTPTSRWRAGEIVPDVHRLALPADLPPGRYALWAGLYEPDTVRNLAVRTPGVRTAGDRVFLGEIDVAAP